VVKTDSLGNQIWNRTYGGDTRDVAFDVQETDDGGYVIAGLTSSFGAGGNDFYVVKTNAQGDTIWTRTYGGVRDDEAHSIQQTADGGSIIAGYKTSSGGLQRSTCVMRIDALGDTLWTRTYGGYQAYSIRRTSDGGYVIAGSVVSGGSYFYVIKTGPDVLDANEPRSLHPSSFSLSAYPNPFNPSTQIAYALPQAGRVSLTVSNLLGQTVADLVNEMQTAGTHTIAFDGSVLPSGIYLYRLQAGEFVQTRKMVLLK
jgi:hypothetical protein